MKEPYFNFNLTRIREYLQHLFKIEVMILKPVSDTELEIQSSLKSNFTLTVKGSWLNVSCPTSDSSILGTNSHIPPTIWLLVIQNCRFQLTRFYSSSRFLYLQQNIRSPRMLLSSLNTRPGSILEFRSRYSPPSRMSPLQNRIGADLFYITILMIGQKLSMSSTLQDLELLK